MRAAAIKEKLAAYSAPGANGCIEWRRAMRGGYGVVFFDAGRHMAHRVAYELAKGPIPSGLEIDHLCRNRRCINPDHLEPVTPRENQRRGFSPTGINARKTHCPKGHPYDGANTLMERGERFCRACRQERIGAKTAERRSRGLKKPVPNKLRAEDVLEIRRAYHSTAGETYQSLASRYGVDLSCIGHIIKGKSWKHLPLNPS